MAGPIIILATYQLDRSKLDADFAKIQQEMKSTESAAKSTGDNISTSIKRGSAAIGDLSTETGRLERTLQRVGERIVAAFAIESVLNFAKSSLEAFNKAELASQKLLFSLDGNKKAYDALALQAKQIEGRLGINQNDIKSVQAYLSAMGLTASQIRKVVEVSLDLSAATGQDLQTSAQQLGATYEGVRGRLGKYSDQIRTMSLAHLEAGGAVDILGEKLKGLSNQVPEGIKAADKLATSWDHLKETVGPFFTEVLSATSDFFSGDMFKSMDALNEENKKLQKTTIELIEPQKKIIETVTFLNNALADAKLQRDENSSSLAQYNEANKRVLEIEAKIAIITGQKTEAQKKADEELKKRLELQKQADKDLVALSGETQKALAAGEAEGLQKRQDLLEADRIATQKKNEERLAADLEAYRGNPKKQLEIKEAFNKNSLALDNALGEAQDKLRREQSIKDLEAAIARQKQNKENLQADFKESDEMFIRLGEDRQLKIDRQLADGTISQKKFNELKSDNDLRTDKERLANAKQYGADKIGLDQKLAADEIQLAQKKAERLKEIEQSIANVITTIADGILSIQAKQRDNEESEAQKQHDKEISSLDDQLKKKHISQKKYDTEKAALDKKFQEEENKRRHDRDVADKNAAVYKILIQAAEAEALDFFTGDVIKAAADAAIAGAQIAIIEATPLPKYAKGTLSVKGGRAGEDSVPALLMPGEAVIPTDQARRHNKALSAMINGGFDEFVLKSYLPRLLEAEQRSSGTISEKMLQGLQFNDRRLIRAIKDSKPDGTVELGDRTISRLASQLSGGNQRASNLYKRYGK